MRTLLFKILASANDIISSFEIKMILLVRKNPCNLFDSIKSKGSGSGDLATVLASLPIITSHSCFFNHEDRSFLTQLELLELPLIRTQSASKEK
jgi:hypothetical protein